MRQLALSKLFQSRQAARGPIPRMLCIAALSCVALLVIAIMTPLGANAQMAGYGAISGTVTDSTGAVIGGATVTATLVDQNVSTTRTTTGAGDYSITPLTPGEYTLTVTAKGFEKEIQEHITVDALVTVGVNVKMSIGAAQQTITVTTAPPVLETTDATLGAVMDNQMYSSLPLLMGAGGNADQRRATDFAGLMPGVVPVWVGSNNATDASLSVNGGNPAGGTSEIYVDGVNLPAPDGVGDVRFIWTAVGMDGIDQFQVQTSGYSAQYAGQGVQNYSIRQGGNSWHGGIYDYIRNTVADAWPFLNKIPTVTGAVPAGQSCVFGSAASSYCAPGGLKPTEIMNEVGAKFGGPILKNKLFMFYNYGQYRFQHGPKIQLQNIPTTAMLNGDFSAFSTSTGYGIWDPGTQTSGCLGSTASPCTRTQFVSTGGVEPVGTLNVIPSNRISGAAKYINTFMSPLEASTLQTQYSNNIAAGYQLRPVELVSRWPHRLRHESEEPTEPHHRVRPPGQHRTQLFRRRQRASAAVQYCPGLHSEDYNRHRQGHLHHQLAHGEPLFAGLCPVQESLRHARRCSAIRCQPDRSVEHAIRPGQLLPVDRFQRRPRQSID